MAMSFKSRLLIIFASSEEKLCWLGLLSKRKPCGMAVKPCQKLAWPAVPVEAKFRLIKNLAKAFKLLPDFKKAEGLNPI